MFPQVYLYVSHHFLLCLDEPNLCYILINLPLRHQSLNYLSQSTRNMSNNFLSLIGFLRVNWNDIFTLLVLWFSQALTFFNYDIFITTTMITLIRDLSFKTQRLCSVAQKTFLRLIFKCFFEDTFSSYRTVSFHIAEIIAIFTKFSNFRKII